MKYVKVKRQNPDQPEQTTPTTAPLRPLTFKKGITQIRILPPYSESSAQVPGEGWFKKYFEHHGIRINDQYTPLACPRQANSPCPICEEGERLYNNGDEDSVAASRDLQPRVAYMYNTIIFSAPDPDFKLLNQVVVTKSGKQLWEQFKDADEDFAGGYGDITNIEKGFDIRVERKGENRNNTSYHGKVIPVRSNLLEVLTARGIDPNTIQENGKLKLFDLDAAVQIFPYEKVKEYFENKQIAPGFPAGPRMEPTVDPSTHTAPVPDETDNSFTTPPQDSDEISF